MDYSSVVTVVAPGNRGEDSHTIVIGVIVGNFEGDN